MWRWCAIAGPVLFTAVWVVLGAGLPGYDPARHWISSLSLAPGVGWVQVVAFLLSGALVVLFAVGLRRTEPDARWGARWVGVVGVGLVAAGVFPIEPALGFPPDGGGSGWTGPLHDAAGLAVFAGLTAAPAAWARRRRRAWSIGCAVAVAGLWVAGGVLAGLDHAGVWSPAPAGLAERASITAGMLWLVTLALSAPAGERVQPSVASR